MTPTVKPISSASGAALTRAQQLANSPTVNRNASFISDALPAWFKYAPIATRTALLSSFEAGAQTQREVNEILAKVQSIELFAQPLLKSALTARGWADVNPRTYGLQHVRPWKNLLLFIAEEQFKLADTLIQMVMPGFPMPETLEWNLISTVSRHSLLQAALQNFEASETMTDGFSAGSGIYRIIDKREIFQNGLKPEQFALICRDLNLGMQYQHHLRSIFEPSDDGLPDHDVNSKAYKQRTLFTQNLRHEFTCALLLAFMKDEIARSHYEAISALSQATTWSSTHASYSTLKITDFEVPGVLIFWPEQQLIGQQQTCVLYLPNRPQPFHTFTSFSLLTTALSSWLKDSTFSTYFFPLVPLRYRSVFMQRVEAAKKSESTLFFQRVPLVNLQISLSDLHPVAHQEDPFSVTWHLQWEKIKDDARLLVVPTEDEDSKSRLKRQATYLNAGISVLTLALGFVPILGEIMLASSVLQMGVDIYEGFRAWQRHDRVEAIKHLFEVAESIAMFAAATGAVAALKPAPARVEAMVPVEFADGRRQLWQPDLTPYESTEVSLAESTPDAQGIYTKDGKDYIKMEDTAYEIGVDTQTQQCFIRHPRDPQAYTPRLRHNLNGAWLHERESPQLWSRLTLFRRLGPEAAEMADPDIEYLLQACNISDDILRKVHLDHLPPPPILADSIKRVRLHEKIERFIASMQQGAPSGKDFSALQLELITQLEGWPKNSVLRVVDSQGRTLKEFGQNGASPHSRIQILDSQTQNGDLLTRILESLSTHQADHLLGQSLATLDQQVAALSRKLGELAQSTRLELFNTLYTAEQTVTAEMQTLHRQFPSLPATVMTELLGTLKPAERAALHETRRLPLPVLEEARVYAQELRLDRALSGLYFESLSNADSQTLAWKNLLELPGWPRDVGWILRDKQTGQLLSTAGSESAALNRELYKHDGVYEYVAPSTGEIYRSPDLIQCVFKALLPAERTALGLTETDAAVSLTRLIADKAVNDRARSAQSLGMRPIKPWFVAPLRLASGRHGYTLGGRSGRVLGERRTLLLKDLIRELYPLMSEEQAGHFLHQLQLSPYLTTQALARLKAELDTLRSDLDRWTASTVWTEPRVGPRRELSLRDKRDISSTLTQAWRRQTEKFRIGDHTGYTLDLNAWPVDCLPELSADFSHISALYLRHSPNAKFPNRFLSKLYNLRALSLRNNQLTELPAAIEKMHELIDLNIQGNQIVLNDRATTVLSRLTKLKTLNLNGNLLGRRISVRNMPQLEQLYLRNTGLLTWPDGVEALTHLKTVDLRDNAISRVPPEVLSPGRTQVNSVTHLHDNPLSADSLLRLELYRREHGISFGITPRRQHRTEVGGIHNWTTLATAEEVLIWRELSHLEDSADFFRVLEDLSGSSQYRHEREELSQRVWNILKALHEHTELRDELFSISANPETCADGIPMIFADLELRYRIFMAAREPNADEALMTLARGLFHIELLNKYVQGVIDARVAAIHANQRGYVEQLQKLADAVSPNFAPEPLANMTPVEQQGVAYRLNTPAALLLAQRLSPADLRARIDRVEPLEIQMYYQVHLAEKLNLPDRPTSMLFGTLAEVTPEQLESARQYVLREDTEAARAAYLEKLGYWERFLERKYASSFREIDSPLHKRLEGIFLARDRLSSQEYVHQTENVQENRTKARQSLIHRLTVEEIEKHPSPHAVQPPSSTEGASGEET